MPRTAAPSDPAWRPDLVRFAAAKPCRLPPVRIFVATEDGQHRAERVLLWSIRRVRDPDRDYEVFLIRDLPGFDQRGWLTGFTNYRFAVPQLAAGRGQAIYNDVDQVYLSDPAELFDHPMSGRGFLSIDPGDTSVMLIDCARMAGLWNIESARRYSRKQLEATAVAGELWGGIDPSWNARDEEHEPHLSRLLHFTTIHTQPWQPFPDQYVYQENPVADIWQEMENAADEAGFEAFSAASPSARWRDGADCKTIPTRPIRIIAASSVRELPAAGGRPLRLCGLDSPGCANTNPPDPGFAPCDLDDLLPAGNAGAGRDRQTADDGPVLLTAAIDSIPMADLPWVLERLFAAAGRFLLLAGAPRTKHRRHRMEILERVARRYPRVHWRLYECGSSFARLSRCGGAVPGPGGPRVWVLSDGKPGHDTQSLGLAEALGWRFEVRRPGFGRAARLQYRLLSLIGAVGANRLGVKDRRAVAPPWPDLVITTGWAGAPLARWIARQSGGATRTLVLGRRGSRIATAFDIVISARYHRLPFAPNRIETVAPLNRLRAEALNIERDRHATLFQDMDTPRIVALVGGGSRRYSFDPARATDLARALLALKRERRGSLFVLTSRRTGAAATTALVETLGDEGTVDRWRKDRADNPYLGCLAHADLLVVTGESESMLAEAAATGKPVLIYPLTAKPDGWWHRLTNRVHRRAHARARNRRGSVRPQQGLEYLCARLLQRGIVQQRRDLDRLWSDLVAKRIAGYFGENAPATGAPPLREASAVAASVRQRLSIWPRPEASEIPAAEPRDAVSRRADAA